MTIIKDPVQLYQIEYPVKQPDKAQIVKYNKKGVNATHICIAFKTCSYHHMDKYTLHLLKNILGSYMSSRLFMLLREKHGLTYTSKCNSIHHSTSGHFEIYTMCNPSKFIKSNPSVLSLLVYLIKDLLKNGITEKELTDAKGHFKGKHILNMEQGEIKCTYNGIEHILYDKNEIVPYENIYKQFYESVTKENVNEVIRKYFRPENMSVCLVGEHIPALRTIHKEFVGFI
jgi:hypothetical protein